jgi:hypothetical protein
MSKYKFRIPQSPSELTDRDRADIDALMMAFDLTLDNDPPWRGKVKEVKDALRGYENHPGREWEVAKDCSLHQQRLRLELPVWNGMDTPCTIHTRENAEAILKRGDDDLDYGTALLVLDMLDAGVSRWHPDPVRAIAEAKQAKRSR